MRKHPKSDKTEEFVLVYFLLPNYTKKRLTRHMFFFFFFFNIMQFEQVGTGQECPLTPVWNIPQVNRIIIKESLLIGNREVSLDASISLFFRFHNLAQIPSLLLWIAVLCIYHKRGLTKGKMLGQAPSPTGSSRSFLTQHLKKAEPGSVPNLRPWC